MTKKIFERSPLKYNIVRWVSCFSPLTIKHRFSEAEKITKKLVLHLMEENWITSYKGKNCSAQFSELCVKTIGPLKQLFEDWDRKQ